MGLSGCPFFLFLKKKKICIIFVILSVLKPCAVLSIMPSGGCLISVRMASKFERIGFFLICVYIKHHKLFYLFIKKLSI